MTSLIVLLRPAKRTVLAFISRHYDTSHVMTESQTEDQVAPPDGGPDETNESDIDFAKLSTPPVPQIVLRATNDAA